VTQDFEKELDSFVERRNTFAHDLHSVPGLDIGTKEGLEIGIEFVRDLREDARHIRDILRGLIRFIAEKAGLDVNSDPENYFNELISEVLALTVFNMNPE
jgi:hypothetical protein